ncbi:hypothetical protein C8R14_11129 [Nitrosomonas eutropha]|uniref:Uncharacterized protein n=1 Tax=Nitrosomonas eutropha TaxID=916 RepID=A0ABX5M8C4_9PROT|nr:hypothetical protein C8R14_11129 [Nitrosomonas eutropha]SEJ30910.1 hypothetical protein SAMN05216318_14510 [Nitrosomonas eutropha]
MDLQLVQAELIHLSVVMENFFTGDEGSDAYTIDFTVSARYSNET